MPREGCDRYLHIIYTVPGYLRTFSEYLYDENPFFSLSGAVQRNTYDGGGNAWITTECSPQTVATQIPHILKVTVNTTVGATWTRFESYPKSPSFNVNESDGNQSTTQAIYFINNERSKPDFWLPNAKFPITEFSVISNTDPFGFYLKAWLGEPDIIDTWVKQNSLNYQNTQSGDLIQQFGGWKMGTYQASVVQYQGSRVGCRIPEAALLKYPFCGTDWRGLGPEYIDLCANDLGACDDPVDCCNCCNAADLFLQTVNDGGFYLVGG